MLSEYLSQVTCDDEKENMEIRIIIVCLTT